ncbi:MAG: hypothetical protein ACM3SQ_09620 [Betaproteobacteria bacterium]
MKKLIVAFAGLLLALPLQAFAQQIVPNSPKRVLNVVEPIVIGTQTVAAGEYTFQCVMIDGREYLLVTSPRTGTQIARVPCTPSSLTSKATVSLYETVPGPGGSRVLKSVQLKGEAVAHNVVGVSAS